MARFRLYQNGIFGHRYKGYYVTREKAEGSPKTYGVADGEGNPIEDGFLSYWDAEWHIDKLTASDRMRELIEKLYGEDVHTLNKFFLELIEKQDREGLEPGEQDMLLWVQKIRSRKADGKPL